MKERWKMFAKGYKLMTTKKRYVASLWAVVLFGGLIYMFFTVDADPHIYKQTYYVEDEAAKRYAKIKADYDKAEAISHTIIEAKIPSKRITALTNKFPDKKWPEQLAKLIPPEYYAAIRVFLLSHEAEFGLFNNVCLIGTVPNTGVTAYNVSLTNGRMLQFWFKADKIYIVGEEINGGFIAHYGR